MDADFNPTSPNTRAEAAPADGAPPSALSDEARRTLVYLLRHGVILAAEKARLFDTLCRYQAPVRAHLADVFLRLVLDERQGVAFVAAAEQEDGDEEEGGTPVSLINRRTLTLYDTLLLLVLRKHYQERENAGEQKIIIDLERIGASLSPFLPLTNHAALDKKHLLVRIGKMVEHKLLQAVRGEDERYEITPLIRYVVNAETLHRLLAEYRRMLSGPDDGAKEAEA
ncbi:hypothetical protein L1281_000659 [Neisseria sp. HSC-16F19]|nr:DUF4194 domain-containing protein [Neisseria sp. HSC-16F19]MCP2040079.1 hypothetical protein [Neisseria sp. HSC-16F19]